MRLLRRRVRHDDGITLIELLVAVSLFGILLVIVSGLYIATLKTVALSRDLTANTKAVSTAMNEATRVVRAGTENPIMGTTVSDPVFVVAKADDMVLYAYINLESAEQQPVMIRLRVDRNTGALVESRWRATDLGNTYWQFPDYRSATPFLTRTLAQTVAPQATGVAPPFTYVGIDGASKTMPVDGLNETARRDVVSVKLNLTVQTSLTDSNHAVTLRNTVGIPNLGFTEEIAP